MKQRLPSAWGAILASALLFSGYLPVRAADPADSIALVGEKAYVLGEARAVPVSRGIVTNVQWSEYGNAALITRMDMTVTPDWYKASSEKSPPFGLSSSVHLWNRKTNQVMEIDRITVANQTFEEVNLLPNERTCYSVVLNKLENGQQRRQLRIVNPGGGTEFVLAPIGGDIEYAPSTGSSSLLVVVNNGTLASGHIDTQMRIYNAEKGKWTPVNITLDTNQVVEYAIYAEHLKSFLIRILGFGGGKPMILKFEPDTGSTNEISEDAFKVEARRTFEALYDRFPHPFTVTSESIKLPDGRSTRALLLGPDQEGTVPAAAGSNRPGSEGGAPAEKADKPLYFGVGVNAYELSPKSDAVLYVVDGMALWREIFPIDRSLVESKVGSPSREELILRAKQVGLGLIMYAGDNDDELPPADGMVGRVMPYVKNEAVFDGFIYTYKGPSNINNIEKPAETELGFIRGNGGSAVLYADGHVRWKPDA